MFNKKLNLSRQLLKSVLAIYFLITLFVTSVHFIIEYNYTKTHIKDELKTIASIFEPALQTALWDLNTEQLESISNGIAHMPLVYGVVIVDPNKVELINKTDSALSQEERLNDELSYSFIIHQKFNNNNIYLANITLYSDDKAIIERLKIGFSMILLNAFIKSSALVFLFILAFRKHLETPLQELTKKISNLHWENKTDRSINVNFTNENELSVLQSKFNQLLEKISSVEENKLQLVHKLNIQLKKDVYSRTRELEEANEKLQKLASTDALTQLSNRSKIDNELLLKYESFKRHNRVFSVIIMDIDFFKKVNDVHGHQIGDYVLQTIASLLQKNIRITDVAGRWGGEEFFIICDETDANGAYIFAENLRQIIETYVFEHIGHITASFGVAQMEKNLSLSGLVKHADDALYEAKNSGRNKSVKATPQKV